MNKTCRFSRTYVRKSKTYTLSFKRLSKLEADLICNIFRSLSSCGVVQVYENGFTSPRYEMRCHVPLARGVKNTFVVPHRSLSAIVSEFNNFDFRKSDVLVSDIGVPLSHINTY